mmetsp:Transcript_13170/g.29090  ORF Transcript_13170/g.29090 Transcript_13170/m.29090 type:complete len:613 (+) Transcript_13170:128-1966(+)
MMAVHIVYSLSGLLFLLFLAVQATASPPLQSSPGVAIDGIEGSTTPLSEGLVGDIIRSSRDYELTNTIAPLPMCWKRVVATLSEVIDIDTSASDFCTSMDPFIMDFLAFELARCHTAKSSKPFIEDSDETLVGFCSGGGIEDQSHLDGCIRLLDENSFNILMQFTMHIQQLCVRFTEELVAAKKEQAALLLAKSSIAASEQLKELIKKNSELIEEVGAQSQVIQGYNDALENIGIEISSTARNVHPIALVAGFISQWYLWLMSFLYFLVASYGVWTLTMNKTSRWLRMVLLNVVLLEALLEMMSHWALSSGNVEMDDHSNRVALLRKGCVVMIILIFTVGSMVSCLTGSKADVVRSHQDSSALTVLSSDVQEDLALERSKRFLTPQGIDARAVATPGFQRTATRFELRTLYRLLLVTASVVLAPVCAYKYALPWAEYCFDKYALPWAVYCFDKYALPWAMYCSDVFILPSIAGIQQVFNKYYALSRICLVAFIFSATFTSWRRRSRRRFTEGVIEEASAAREEALDRLAATGKPVYVHALRDEIAYLFHPCDKKKRGRFVRYVWRVVEQEMKANNGIIKRKLDTTHPHKPPLEHWEMMQDVKYRRLNMKRGN